MPVNGAATLRLMSDLKAISQEPPDGCSASPVTDSNLFIWTATIFGPEDTPWEGGIFSLQLKFPQGYPGQPPAVVFTSNMFHPNVYSDGNICLDILEPGKWSPCQSVSSILTSIQSLLQDPNIASPANPEAADLYKSDRKEFNRRVRRCAQRSLE